MRFISQWMFTCVLNPVFWAICVMLFVTSVAPANEIQTEITQNVSVEADADNDGETKKAKKGKKKKGKKGKKNKQCKTEKQECKKEKTTKECCRKRPLKNLIACLKEKCKSKCQTAKNCCETEQVKVVKVVKVYKPIRIRCCKPRIIRYYTRPIRSCCG